MNGADSISTSTCLFNDGVGNVQGTISVAHNIFDQVKPVIDTISKVITGKKMEEGSDLDGDVVMDILNESVEHVTNLMQGTHGSYHFENGTKPKVATTIPTALLNDISSTNHNMSCASYHSMNSNNTSSPTDTRGLPSFTDSNINNHEKGESMETGVLTVAQKTLHNPDSNTNYWEGCSVDNRVAPDDTEETNKCKQVLDFDDVIFPIELASSHHFSNGNFFKGGKWSPDGLCFLTSTNDNCIRLFNTPFQYLHEQWDSVAGSTKSDLQTCFRIQESGCIFDFTWYPLMNSQNPATCCFASTAKDQPVHLWDAFDGSLRASYIYLNSVQEVQAAHSICFSPGGGQLLCGLKRFVSYQLSSNVFFL